MQYPRCAVPSPFSMPPTPPLPNINMRCFAGLNGHGAWLRAVPEYDSMRQSILGLAGHIAKRYGKQCTAYEKRVPYMLLL